MRGFMKYLLAFIIFLSCFGFGVWIYSDNSDSQAKKALEEFYNYQGFAEKRGQVLSKGGNKLAPILIKKVKDKNTKYRFDIIHFLANNTEARPVLQNIVKDETEDNYTRKLTLEAIYSRDQDSAKEIAKDYLNDSSFLGEFSNCILSHKLYCF